MCNDKGGNLNFLSTSCGNIYKYLDKYCGDFYTPKRILSYGRPWNFVTGSRSVGKSTGIALLFLLDFIVNYRKFIYCRRDQDAVMLTCQTFFPSAVSIINKFGDFHIEEFFYHAKKYFIRMEGEEEPRECGGIIPLSLENKYKSANYSEFFNLVFDEFIEKDATKYLGSAKTPDKEYKSCLSLYQTIDRGIGRAYRNETRFFFLGNTATIYNPMFLKMGISELVTQGAKFIAPKGKLWLLERVETVKALEGIENSFAYLLADEEERAYAYKNTGADSNDFIGKLDTSIYLGTFILNGTKYGVRKSVTDYPFMMSIGPADSKHNHIAISLDNGSHDGRVDLKLINNWRKCPLLMTVADAYVNGRLLFHDGRTKLEFLKYLQFVPV